jgi:PKD repeat protein
MMDPVVVNMNRPRMPFRLPKLPHFSERANKIIIITAAVVICISMVTVVIATVIANSSRFRKAPDGQSQNTPAPSTGSTPSAAALPGGESAIGKGGTANNDSPVVTIKATPSSVSQGGISHLEWSATKNPTSCTASDDWSGTKPIYGAENTQALTKQQTYMFTLTCKNASGTGFATVSVGVISQGGSGSVGRPVVTLAANPSSIYINDKSTLVWSATNSPTSCTASGSWSGDKPAGGSENTAALTNVSSYTYTLTCKNSAGSGFATTSVNTTVPPANLPIVTISSSALGAQKPGATPTITWSVANTPTSCTAGDDWSGSKPAHGSEAVGPLNAIKTYSFKLTCSNAAGVAFDNVTVKIIPSPPVVSLTASPASVTLGGSATLNWLATNSPTSCTASGSWSGTKPFNGTQSTGALTTVKTYTYSLSCTNAGGTGFANNVPVQVVAPDPPDVTLSINPISTTVGNSATLTWSATNSPASCTASGSWTGSKAASGSQSTGALGTAKTYTYNLSCSNPGGSGSASASITVSSGQTTTKPTITIALNPTTIGTGSSSTLSWSAANSPTSCTASGAWSGSKAASGSTSTGVVNAAGSQTYTLTCSNSAGSATASATLTVLATPVISISVNPNSITTGGNATLTWSVTNNPTSCTAGGSWTGSKAASGSQTVSPGSAGNYTYSLSCTNSGGTTSKSAVLSVNQQQATYCGGQTPCIGRSELASHSNIGSCWGYNLDWVINITQYAPHHKGGTKSGSLESAQATCNHDIHAILGGTATIPGYTDKNNAVKHNHNNATENNLANSQLSSYMTGYYDPNKP